jgi:hypothetical protein
MQNNDQTVKPKTDETPRAHELTAFELALVTGGSGCPSTAYARVAKPKPPVDTKL